MYTFCMNMNLFYSIHDREVFAYCNDIRVHMFDIYDCASLATPCVEYLLPEMGPVPKKIVLRKFLGKYL